MDNLELTSLDGGSVSIDKGNKGIYNIKQLSVQQLNIYVAKIATPQNIFLKEQKLINYSILFLF